VYQTSTKEEAGGQCLPRYELSGWNSVTGSCCTVALVILGSATTLSTPFKHIHCWRLLFPFCAVTILQIGSMHSLLLSVCQAGAEAIEISLLLRWFCNWVICITSYKNMTNWQGGRRGKLVFVSRQRLLDPGLHIMLPTATTSLYDLSTPVLI
jgi:hypothetical protein